MLHAIQLVRPPKTCLLPKHMFLFDEYINTWQLENDTNTYIYMSFAGKPSNLLDLEMIRATR